MNTSSVTRREFLRLTAASAAGLGLTGCAGHEARRRARAPGSKSLFDISLAEWSLHRALFGRKLDHLDFPKTARQDFDIGAIELVNQFFPDKARDAAYLTEFKKRAAGEGVRVLLIMIDREGALGDADPAARTKAVENHYKWVEAGKFFGCHSIRVNAETKGVGSFAEQQERAADGLRRLSQFAAGHGLNVIVENHGGLSSHGAWLVGVMRKVNLPNCGTLPDFGNFQVSPTESYDRYKGVAEMMPFAKAVSAKSHDFDSNGNETRTDYRRMLKVVLNGGYRRHFGIEYEGDRLSEPVGILATKRLLMTVRDEMSVKA